MPKRSKIIRNGVFRGLPENIAKQIGEAKQLSKEPGYTDCWPWKGMISGGHNTNLLPYGRAKTWTSRETLVHRIIYELNNGPIPEGLKVLHLCNHSLCCNPRHMKLGTQQENMQHMATCKRAADVKGVKNPKSILNPAQVLEIRNAYSVGETAISISCLMKFQRGTVCAVLLRDRTDKSKYKFWQDVGGPMRPEATKRKPHDKFGPHAETIRLEYGAGATVNELAQKWCASQGAIKNILLGVNHADRPGPIFSSLRWGNAPSGRPAQRLAALAREIRLSYENQGTVHDLADKYGVTSGSIAKILLGQTYPNEGGPIFSKPLHYTDLKIRPPKNEPRFVVRTQHIVQSGKFAGLPDSVIRKIGEPVNRKDAMGYTGCWPWTGYLKAGYGGGRKSAHRRLYEWANGPIAPGLLVMHLCKQRDCCNPDHLKAGTRSDISQ